MATKNSPETLSAPALRPVRYDDEAADTPIARARRALLDRGIRRVRGVTPSNPGVREEHPAVVTWNEDGEIVAARMVTAADLEGCADVLAAGIRDACNLTHGAQGERSAFAIRGWNIRAGVDAGEVNGDRLAWIVARVLLDKHPAVHGASYVATLARADGAEARALALGSKRGR